MTYAHRIWLQVLCIVPNKVIVNIIIHPNHSPFHNIYMQLFTILQLVHNGYGSSAVPLTPYSNLSASPLPGKDHSLRWQAVQNL